MKKIILGFLIAIFAVAYSSYYIAFKVNNFTPVVNFSPENNNAASKKELAPELAKAGENYTDEEKELIPQLEERSKYYIDVTKIFEHYGIINKNVKLKDESEVEKYMKSISPNIENWISELVYRNPQLSFIAGGYYNYMYECRINNSSNTYYIYKISIDFSDTYALTQDEWEFTKNRLDYFADSIPKDISDVEKIRLVNKYLLKNTSYDKSVYTLSKEDRDSRSDYKSYTPYNVGNGGVAVCEGYSKAVNMILNRIGIKTRIVSSQIQNHAWNIVMIDGKWYNVDVTWNDTDWFGFFTSEKYLLKSNDKLVSLSNSSHRIMDEQGYDVTDTRFDNGFK